MNTEYETAHQVAQKRLTQKYSSEGYEVIEKPSSQHIPFDLDGYCPDLLARKDDSKLIIEVKTKPRFSIERFQRIAQLIAQHKHEGWRFILITLDDMLEDAELDAEKNYRSWEEIAQQMTQTPLIINAIGNNAALLYIWGICEAVLRKFAVEAAIPVERLPFDRLAKYLYSEGELSMSELDTLLVIHKQRNKVAHGFKTEVMQETLDYLINFINKSLTEWTAVAS